MSRTLAGLLQDSCSESGGDPTDAIPVSSLGSNSLLTQVLGGIIEIK
jgi:hypothetical protein